MSSLRELADNTTSAVVAFLSLTAAAVLLYGLLHAIILNRRTQVIVSDIVAPNDSTKFAEMLALSSIARQGVEHSINDQRAHVIRISKMILPPTASRGLKPQFNSGTIMHVRRDANDSIAKLSAALRAIAPGKADPFTGLFSVVLPPPRGFLVTITLLLRGTDTEPRLGTAVDVASLDQRPIASAVFWEAKLILPVPATGRDSDNERLLALLEPVARWVAVRLVVTLMIPSRRVTSRTYQGYARLLAGGLFLAAMRDFSVHALAFGEQACKELEQARKELEQARQKMPDVSLPITTLAAVYERMGWAYQTAGRPEKSSENFLEAVTLWRQAEDVTRDYSKDNKEARLTILADRRLKAQLLTDDPTLQKAALKDIENLDSKPISVTLKSNHTWLYNRSCLYAQASRAAPNPDYQRQALRWLGRALIRGKTPRSWDYARRDDPELAPIRDALPRFLAMLRGLATQDTADISDTEVDNLVAQALAAMPDAVSGRYWTLIRRFLLRSERVEPKT